MSDTATTTTDPQAALMHALVKARGEFARIEKDGVNPHLHNKYATLGAVLDAVIEPLLSNGILVIQTPIGVEGGKWALETRIRHRDGGELVGLVPLEYGDAKGLNPMQALGSAISYGRRYGLLSLLCLSVEDDDGASAGSGFPKQLKTPRSDDRRPPLPPRGVERRNNGKPPETGRALYAWVKDQEEQSGVPLVKGLQSWGKKQGFDDKMTNWSPQQVQMAVGAVQRKLDAADDEAEAVAQRESN
jgi:hypothetical protein